MQSLYPLIPVAVVAAGLVIAVVVFRKKSGGGSASGPSGSRGRPGADKH